MPLDSVMTPGAVYGPTLYKGRRYVTIQYDGTKRSMTYARWLYQEHHQRVLGPDEHVDHIDGNKLNDVIENYQVLTNSQNASKEKGPTEWITFTCPGCGREATKEARKIRHNRKQGKAGPFCSRSCAGRHKPF